MGFQVGDMVFTRDGRPSVVTGRRESGHVELERKGEAFENKRKLGLTNGLNSKNRSEFESIIREVRSLESPEARVDQLRSKVAELGQEPSNRVLKRYLESEMSFIMNSEGVHPNTFVVEERNI